MPHQTCTWAASLPPEHASGLERTDHVLMHVCIAVPGEYIPLWSRSRPCCTVLQVWFLWFDASHTYQAGVDWCHACQKHYYQLLTNIKPAIFIALDASIDHHAFKGSNIPITQLWHAGIETQDILVQLSQIYGQIAMHNSGGITASSECNGALGLERLWVLYGR